MRRLPFVFLNVALSADGKLATANHAVTSPGSKRDLAHLYELRTTADASLYSVTGSDSSPPPTRLRTSRDMYCC